MKIPLDQFSAQPKYYKKFRPTYPNDLYGFILSYVSNFEKCWDCGTGNGQVALKLSEYFKEVYASDISQNQIDHAFLKDNIEYSVQRAEQTTFPEAFFDLITVAQALHWFDFKAFNDEVRRVLKPNGLLAVWGYGLLRVNHEIDVLIDTFYRDVIGKYWASERRYVESQYQTIALDIQEFEVNKQFNIELEWTIDHLEGYLNSWSAVQNYISIHNHNPVPECIDSLSLQWGTHQKFRMLVFLRLGRPRDL